MERSLLPLDTPEDVVDPVVGHSGCPGSGSSHLDHSFCARTRLLLRAFVGRLLGRKPRWSASSSAPKTARLRDNAFFDLSDPAPASLCRGANQRRGHEEPSVSRTLAGGQ
jgi:hypothetical protein